MTNTKKILALGAAVALVSCASFVSAQDDLDALLKDLESETPAAEAEAAKPAEAEPAPAEEAAPAAEEAPAPESPEAPEAEEAPAPETPETPEAPEEEEAPAEEAPAAEAPEAPETLEEEEAPAEEAPAAETPESPETPEEEEAPAEEAPAAETPESPETPEEEAPAEEAAPESPETPDIPAAPAQAADATKEKDELLENIITAETNRRLQRDVQARKEMNEARLCMKTEEYLEAEKHYSTAEKLLGDIPANKALRKECVQGSGEAFLRAAKQELALGQDELALEHLQKAIDRGHPKARRLMESWKAEGVGFKGTPGDKISKMVRHRRNDPDYKYEREHIRRLLLRGTHHLGVGDLDKALEDVETVLVNDKYNVEAIRLRKAIIARRAAVLQQERVPARAGMIADVDEAWRPVYAVNAASLSEGAAETVKSSAGDDPERTTEQEIIERMKAIRLPEIKFNPPATIMDAVQFFIQASKDYDNPELPPDQRGFNFYLRPREQLTAATEQPEEANDFSSTGEEDESAQDTHGLAPIPTISANNISFYEALKLVCDSVDYKFIVRGSIVMVMHKDMSTSEILARKYNVPESFIERVSSASDEIKTMGGGFGSSGSNNSRKRDDAEESPDQDWKAFFSEMGVQWPEGSSIKHIKSLGKLYVRNTRENLAEFEKVLDELGGQPQLIEIETRFVEVSQEDLNSLGFEWILNDNYTFGLGRHVGKWIGLHDADFISNTTDGDITQSYTYNADGTVNTITTHTEPGSVSKSWQRLDTSAMRDSVMAGKTPVPRWGKKQIGINAFGGTSEYGNGSRYLSTEGNHISGEGKSTNDQFMRFNAFLGDADLSMILHMLSQRSDTDLLSAPKVVTQSGQQAVIKVVTEFIYPQDYDVQLQSSSSSSGHSSGSSQSAILAVVEPQNFTMREVGVILDVTPTYSEANGGSIDLELKPQVVDDPIWKNYGMKIPFTGNSSLQNFEGLGEIFTGLSEIFNSLGTAIPTATKAALAQTAMDSADDALQKLATSGDNITYYDAPMEQPFFHVRSIESKVSITPGATVVMGGLITENRKAMDDKVPFLGDLPFIGRLFRSHAEKTVKRNLLVFVTGRLITPAGRELKVNELSAEETEVKAAPKAE